MKKIHPYFQEKIDECKANRLKILDLSPPDAKKGPRLTSVPNEVLKMTWLEVLNLSGNRLTIIPWHIYKLTKLITFDVSINLLTDLREPIGNLRKLISFSVGGNQLTTLPKWIGNLTKLIILNVGGNQLKTLPESIGKLKNLKTLNINSNQLTSLPESIGNLKNLKTLNINSNQLTSLPESIGKLKKLTSFSVGDNKLTVLPKVIGNLTNLTMLNISSNKLISLPTSIDELKKLTSFSVGDNKLTILPKVIGNLMNLTMLDIRGNKLTGFPESIGNLTKLTTLSASNNRLTSLQKSIGNLKNLTTLDVNENRLTSLPESIGNLKNLTKLDVNENRLTAIPKSIDNLTNLTTLYISRNQLTSLPESIGNLKNLTELNVTDNKLTSLPESIGNLKNLTELAVVFNQLISLPESIGNLTNLTKLYVWKNQLTVLPESIGNLKNLTELAVSSNQLTILPESIGNLTELTELYVSKNKLTSLPESIENLTKLTNFKMAANPLESPPIDIAEKGIKAIADYFRQLKEAGSDYLYEAKLLIVGEPGAGKTTLARKLKDENAEMPKEEESTKGIDISNWSFFQGKDKQDFRVNVWDFGGQEIYLATHRFFLTHRSLYIILADSRKDDTYFYYWLRSIELFGGDSPVLIITNEKDDRPRPLNVNRLKEIFPNCKDAPISSNLKTKRGLKQIHYQIKQYMTRLPHVGTPLPKTWVDVRKKLEQDKRNYIDLKEYLEFCDEAGFKRKEDKLQLLGHLHALGVCLHYESLPLKKIVFLKPQWCTDAVYKILDNKDVIKNFGKFTHQEVERIWYEEQYKDVQYELLQLMINFRLCYEVTGKKATYVAPQLLTEDEPDYKWDGHDNLQLRYEYEFMPRGLIWRFIVAMHRHILKQKYVWRSGVILKKGETLANVIEYYHKRYIEIRISGEKKHGLMAIIRHEFDKIHADYGNRLPYNELIPCNCKTCKKLNDPYLFTREELKERQKNNKRTIECKKPPHYYDVDVKKLLDEFPKPAGDIYSYLNEKDIENFIEYVKNEFALIPYQLSANQNEAYYHSHFFRMLSDSGVDVDSENSTNIGRIDIVAEFPDKIYIIELKCNKSANEALNQIIDNKYYEKFLNSGKEIYLMGINFDPSKKNRNIKDWKWGIWEDGKFQEIR